MSKPAGRSQCYYNALQFSSENFTHVHIEQNMELVSLNVYGQAMIPRLKPLQVLS